MVLRRVLLTSGQKFVTFRKSVLGLSLEIYNHRVFSNRNNFLGIYSLVNISALALASMMVNKRVWHSY